MATKKTSKKSKKPYVEPEHPTWEALLHKAVNEPGTVSKAYSMFHTYSVGNQMLAMEQEMMMGKQIQPISSYDGWAKAGRQVKKGEHRSIVLCMPITRHYADEDKNGDIIEHRFTKFVYRRYWFTLDQTDANQHVNSLVYIRSFLDAAQRRLAATGQPLKLRSRAVDIAYRKPCFAGDRVRAHLRLFDLAGAVGAAGSFVGDDGKPRCYVRVLFGA